MGGLKRYMPRTRLTYTMGYVALAGFPFIAAGFYSKDMILDAAWEYNRLIFWILLGTAGLTAFYMTRQMMLVFEGRWSGGPKNPEPGHGGHDAGSAHGGHDSHGHDAHGHDAHGHDAHAGHDHGGHDDGGHAAHDAPGNGHGGHDDAHGGHGGHGHHGEPHESGWVMVGPLCLLAVLAIGSGLVGMPGGWLWGNAIYPFLHYSRVGLDSTPHQAITPMVFFPGLVLPILAALFGRWIYHDRVFRPTASRTPSRFEMRLYGLSLNKFYFDEIYWKLLIVPLFPLTNMLKFVDIWIVDGFVKGMGWIGLGLSLLWGRFDRAVIDGAVNGVAQVSRAGGNLLRTMQTGQIQNYILVALGGAMLLIWALVRGQVFH
jgi:NADH:ubiquinone oxidoreductase subunit 5 (subunit L)/multisubunit Na+/H+ antiporter MnhA subunit